MNGLLPVEEPQLLYDSCCPADPEKIIRQRSTGLMQSILALRFRVRARTGYGRQRAPSCRPVAPAYRTLPMIAPTQPREPMAGLLAGDNDTRAIRKHGWRQVTAVIHRPIEARCRPHPDARRINGSAWLGIVLPFLEETYSVFSSSRWWIEALAQILDDGSALGHRNRPVPPHRNLVARIQELRFHLALVHD
jgi:hypothetical protein